MGGVEREHRYGVAVEWTGNLGVGTLGYRGYGRDHVIAVTGKSAIAGSADVAFRGDAGRWNPEELLVASIAACHQLWYLHLCADAGIVVVAYRDAAVGVMVEGADGPRELAGGLMGGLTGGRFTGVTLRPRVVVRRGDDLARAAALHEAAHRLCFVANSMNFPIACEPDIVPETGDGGAGG